jgi:hypothetical protein
MNNNLNIRNYVIATIVLLVFSIISIKISSIFYSNIKKIQTVRSEWKVTKQRTGTVVGRMTEEFKDSTIKKTTFVRVEKKLVPVITDSNYRIGNTLKINLTNEEIYKKGKMPLVNNHLVYCITCILIFLPLFIATVIVIFKQVVRKLDVADYMWGKFIVILSFFISIISAIIVFILSMYSIIKFV